MQHYRKAYSTMFECEVYIVNSYYDGKGELIFICEEDIVGLRDHIFRESELTNFQ